MFAVLETTSRAILLQLKAVETTDVYCGGGVSVTITTLLNKEEL